MTNRGRLVVFSLVGLIGLVGCSYFHGSGNIRIDFRQVADAQDLTTILIETRNGSIEAHCVPGVKQVEITGSKIASGPTEAEARAMAERIEIRVERPADRPGVLRVAAEFPPGTSGGASFRVVLPVAIGLDLRTSNASVTATGAARELSVGTSNDTVKADGVAGQVVARTTNASVTVRNVAGNVEAESSNGSIHLQDVGGTMVVATTRNGGIEAHGTRGDVRLSSSNGRIEWSPFSLPDKPDVRISTSNAGIHIGVPATVRATLGLNTTNASIHAELNGLRVADLKTNRNSLSATLNGGGGQIEARTSNGHIDFGLTAPRPASPQAAAQGPEASSPDPVPGKNAP